MVNVAGSLQLKTSTKWTLILFGDALTVTFGFGSGVRVGVGVGVGVSVAVSYSSAVARTLLLSHPAAMSTLPLRSSVAVWSERGKTRLPVALQVPLAGSYSSALARKL